MKKLKLLNIFGFLVVGVGFYSAYLADSFANHPKTPNPSTGYTIPYSAKPITVYISEDENLKHTLAFYGRYVGFAIYALIFGLQKMKEK